MNVPYVCGTHYSSFNEMTYHLLLFLNEMTYHLLLFLNEMRLCVITVSSCLLYNFFFDFLNIFISYGSITLVVNIGVTHP